VIVFAPAASPLPCSVTTANTASPPLSPPYCRLLESVCVTTPLIDNVIGPVGYAPALVVFSWIVTWSAACELSVALAGDTIIAVAPCTTVNVAGVLELCLKLASPVYEATTACAPIANVA